METKLTIRVSQELLAGAKRYAQQNHTTLTRLVSEYLRRLTLESDPLLNAPVVQRLSGVISGDVSLEDYRRHLNQKYDA